jgi:hypothetical protein
MAENVTEAEFIRRVDELKAIMKTYDRPMIKQALHDIQMHLSFEGYRLTTLKKIGFEVERWERSEPKDGCITYTSTGVAEITLINEDGQEQKHKATAAGKKVIIAGNVAHLDASIWYI